MAMDLITKCVSNSAVFGDLPAPSPKYPATQPTVTSVRLDGPVQVREFLQLWLWLGTFKERELK